MESRPLYSSVPYDGTAYGGAPLGDDVQDREVGVYATPKRKRLNGLALLECILLPWGIFVGVYWVLSFYVHYDHVEATFFLVFTALTIPIGFVLKWYWHRNEVNFVSAELHSWYIYLAVACFVAWLAGFILGSSNFSTSMSKYYDLSSMGLSRDVDPRATSGNRILDTSRVYFQEGSHIYQEYAIGYKDSSVYCVAPIVIGNQSSTPMASFSYWAVGVDCCTPMPPASFWCGSNVFDPAAHAALRWPGDTTYFKRAIEMAEAEYDIRSNKPLFFTWIKDPEAETQKYQTAGVHAFHVGIWAYLVFQAVCFCGVATYYWRNYMAIAGRRP